MTDTDHTERDQGVISVELARVILGGRGPARIELRMDHYGALARYAIAQRIGMRSIGIRLAEALRPIVEHVARVMRNLDPAVVELAKRGESS